MTYATLADLVARFGNPELIALTDREEMATGEINSDMVAAALVEADNEINSYLAKVRTTPLDPVPGQVKRLAVDIARYRLHRDNPPDNVVTDYKSAVAWLRMAAAGDVSLGDDTAPTAPATAGEAIFDAPCRTFTRDSMRGF